jgi:hypothetical protein
MMLATLPAYAGVHYKSRTYQEGQGAADQMNMEVEAWVEGEAAKVVFTESGNPFMKKGSYLLTRDGGQTVYLVNTEDKTYGVWDLNAMLNTASAAMESMGSFMQMEISDPKVETLLEEPGGEIAGFDTTHYRFRTSYSMEMKIMGMKRGHDQVSVQDMWVTSELDLPGLGLWLRKDPPKMANSDLQKLVQAEMSKAKGWPLKTVDETTTVNQKGGESTVRTITEVYELKETDIDEGMFSIPDGYQQVDLMPAMPAEGEPQEEQGGFRGLFGKKKG